MAGARGLIVTHGDLGAEMLRVAALVMGEVDGLTAVSNQGKSIAELSGEIGRHLADAKAAEAGILVLIDVYGGSCSTAAQLAGGEDAPPVILAGVNLAMLLCFMSWRDSLDLDDLAQRVLEKGREAITRVGGA